jgi:PAS domain S-box-containing protein
MSTKRRVAKTSWSVGSYLVALALCCTLPVTIVAAFLALNFVRAAVERERSFIESRLYLLRDAVDQRIELAVRVLESLATSPSLQTGDFDAFRVSAAETARSLGVLVIVLSDGTGRQLVNTRAPLSQPVPPRAHLEAQDRVLATGEPQVSDLYKATLDQRPVITVEVPVRVEGKIRYILSMGVEPGYLSTLMKNYVPPGFIGAIVDRNGILIARQGPPNEPDLVGKPTIPAVRAHLNEPSAFWIEAVSRTGVPTFTSILHSRVGWVINLAVPRSLLEGPFRQATTFVLGIAAIALTVSLFLVRLVARRLSSSAVLLEDAAERIGAEEPVTAAPTKVREYDRALAAFAGASNKISLRAAERDRAESALRESELRWRSIAETLPNLIWTGLPDGQCDWLSSQWSKYTGIPEQRLLGHNWLDQVVHPDDRERTGACWQAACEGRADYDLEYRIRRYDGEYRWFKTRGVPLKDDTGKIVYWFGTCTDIDDIRSAEQREQMLMREVNHRAKNILALVQAIARQTVFNSPQEFIERFDERLRALAANQDLLVKSGWKEVALDALVRTQLAHFDDMLDHRITISGPPLHLNAGAAQTVGIILHELSTNATKYGALSCAGGRVAVNWTIEKVSHVTTRFHLSWTEAGGPRVVAPTRAGFGSTVLQTYAKMSLNADVSLL